MLCTQAQKVTCYTTTEGEAWQQSRNNLPQMRERYPHLRFMCSESECGNGSMEHGWGKHATSSSITGPYTLDTLYNDGEPLRHEAPTVWKRLGEERWVLMYDNYSKDPDNFGFAETTDFRVFTSIGHFDEPGCIMTRTNFIEQKHGSVMPVTVHELETLIEHWNN